MFSMAAIGDEDPTNVKPNEPTEKNPERNVFRLNGDHVEIVGKIDGKSVAAIKDEFVDEKGEVHKKCGYAELPERQRQIELDHYVEFFDGKDLSKTAQKEFDDIISGRACAKDTPTPEKPESSKIEGKEIEKKLKDLSDIIDKAREHSHRDDDTKGLDKLKEEVAHFQLIQNHFDGQFQNAAATLAELQNGIENQLNAMANHAKTIELAAANDGPVLRPMSSEDFAKEQKRLTDIAEQKEFEAIALGVPMGIAVGALAALAAPEIILAAGDLAFFALPETVAIDLALFEPEGIQACGEVVLGALAELNDQASAPEGKNGELVVEGIKRFVEVVKESEEETYQENRKKWREEHPKRD
jgi:hypothetical protein